jgi:branched-chain amino acid transport system substrate-binding protein
MRGSERVARRSRAGRVARLAVVPVAVMALLVAGCGSSDNGGGGGSGGGESSDNSKPLTIGLSLPLTGDLSQPGKEASRGYKIWQDTINKNGGLLGRQVQLKMVDDASDQKTIVTDYQRLISQEKVDLLLGTFSSLLNIPASAVAEKNGMLYVEPAGGAEEMFTRGFKHLFFAQEATAPHQADLLSQWICQLPADKKPKSAAYISIDDPFAEPVVAGMKPKLEACGVKTAYGLKTYPTNQTSFDAVVSGIKSSGAEIVLEGAVFDDAIGVIREMKQQGYNPKLLFQTSAPSESEQYSKGIGIENTEGIFYAVSWDKHADTTENKELVDAYHKDYGGADPAEDAADAFATAQVLQAAVEGTKSLDQDKLADWLHKNSVDTVEGKLSWDSRGAPTGNFLLAQWQGGESRIVLPPAVATSDKIVYPKPPWK